MCEEYVVFIRNISAVALQREKTLGREREREKERREADKHA